ncbi:MAG: hypothetical protein ACWGO1_12905 [Anaerolineales bacterium]
MVVESPPETQLPAVRRRRPLSVTLLVCGVLTLAGINFLRFAVSLQQWVFLNSTLPVNPLYLSASGLIWAVTGLVLAAGLWLRRAWAVRATQLAALAYSLYFWVDRIFIAQGAGRNWLFVLAANLLFVFIVFWILSNRKAKAYFGAMHD